MFLSRLQIILSLSIAFIFFISAIGCQSILCQRLFKGDENFEIKAVIPESNEINGWTREGEMVYCEDLVCLASLINGAAPYYIEGGAMKIIFQDFQESSKNLRLSLEVYQTKNPSQAQALYTGTSSISPISIESLGESGRMDQGLIGSYRVEAYKKNFFIRLVSNGKSEPIKEEILSFAKKIISKIPE